MELTNDYHERTRLFSAKSFVGNLFAMSTPWLFALANTERFRGTGGNEADGMRYVSILIAAIIIPLSFWWTAKLREPGFAKASKQEKTPFWKDMKRTFNNRNFTNLTFTIFTLAMGFNFVNLLGSYIPIFYVFGGDKVAGARLLGINGTIWAITGVLAVFPLNWISPKLGKRNTLVLAMILMSMAQLSKIICYNPHHPYLVLIPTFLLSAGMLFFFTLGSSMVGDICDEDELKTGYRAEGSYYAIFWWFIKMGTALASFVAGVLIVLTLFDQTQVTKVDSLQGSIRELRSKVQYWEGYKGLEGTTAVWLKNTKAETSEALSDARDYVIYLEKEAEKKPDKKKAGTVAVQAQRKNVLLNSKTSAQSIVIELEKIQVRIEGLGSQAPDSLVKAIISDAMPLTLQVRLLKARVNSFELLSHLEARSIETKNSKQHYQTLMQEITVINNRLADMNKEQSLSVLDKELGTIESEIMPLTKQTPYTLLMMRIVEIGLPVLLCLFSFIFVIRYTLTEKRSHEIKELLRQRSIERTNGNGSAGAPADV